MLDISLLGAQRVAADGSPLEALRSPRTLGLLAYLALSAGTPQLRSHMAGVFWPDSTEAQARTNLRRELHQLRSALPEPDRCLSVDATALCWRPDAPCTLDVAVFEASAAEAEAAHEAGDRSGFQAAAQRAVGAYGGELMPAFYDDWVLVERERLHRRCIVLLDRLAVTLAEDGSVPTAVGHARRRVELEPLEESGYRALMELQAGLDDRAAALRTFHRCTSVLERELGVEPSPETLAVHRQLLARPVEPVALAPALSRAVPLVGRDDELGVLWEAWAKVSEGPRLMVVCGEAGVGKTRVAGELFHAVQRGRGSVAHARCFRSRARLALAPVSEWLRSPAIADGVWRLEMAWRNEVARLIPEVGASERSSGTAPLTDAWQRRRFFEGLARAVLAADGPTLLVLDDVQWCDAETLAWLELLLHLDSTAPLLVMTTLRSEELDQHAEPGAWLRGLRADGLVEELELAPLGHVEVAELAGSLRGRPLDEAAGRRLQERTGGFPLFVIESLRQGSAGSSRVDAILAGRFVQLSTAAADLAGLAAAVGRDFSLDLLAAAGDLDDEALVTAIDDLWRKRIVREHSATTYDFTHDLMRDAAYGRLTAPQRQLRHRHVAAALEELHAEDPGAFAGQIAEQHERGGQPDQAIHYHALAAEAATAVFAHADAVRHHSEALALLDDLGEGATARRATALVGMGVAQRHAGDPRHQRTLLDAAALARRLGDADLVAQAVFAVAEDGFWSPSFSPDAERSAVVRAALNMVSSEQPELRAQLLARLALEVYLDRDLRGAARLIDEAESIARNLGDPEVLLNVLATRSYATQDPQTLRTMHEVVAECVELAEQIGDPLRLAHECLRLDSSLRKVGNTGPAQAALDRATSIAEQLEHPPTAYWVADAWIAQALYEGNPEEADRRAREAETIGRSIGFPDTARRTQYAAFAVLLLGGRLHDLEPLAEAGATRRDRAPAVQAGGARVLLDAGRIDEARAMFEDLVERLEVVPFEGNWHTTLCFLAHLAHALGDSSRAARLHDHLGPYAGMVLYTGPAVYGTTDHALGLAAAGARRLEDAARHFADAAAFEQQAGMRGWLMFTQLEWARLLLERGDDAAESARARGLLEQAQRTATEIGNRAVLADARSLASEVASAG